MGDERGLVERALARRLAQTAARTDDRIPRRAPDAPAPLSFAQQRLWFLHQWEPDSPGYNIPRALRVEGPLDVPALEAALHDVAERHEVLRTTYAAQDGRPVQVIHPPRRDPLPLLDVSGLAPDAREAEVARLAREETRRGFDLSRDPPMRAQLLRLGEASHVLLLTFHHIALDGWSLGVFARELRVLYRARRAGAPSPLPDLPVQYADYAAWQRQPAQEDALRPRVEHWRRRLEGLADLALPTDHPRPPVQSFRGAHHAFRLDAGMAARVRALAKEAEATPFMVLLAAFQVLLRRLTGQEDVAVGSVTAGRSRREVEPLLGFFVNTVILRADLAGDPTFREAVARVKRTCLDAYANQDVPFERLVEELAPERDMSRNPLVQVAFALQTAPTEDVTLDDAVVTAMPFESGTAKFDLMLSLWDEPEGLRGLLEYRTDLFEAATIARFRDHFETLLEDALRAPDLPTSRLAVLTPALRRQVLHEWSGSRVERPRDATLVWLIEVQAARVPGNVAVACGDRVLTYAELNARANQVARLLVEDGVGPGVLVGVAMERSVDLVVAILGVLKAGGAYVPLDPSYPRERLAAMLDDARPPVLLAQRRVLDQLPPHPRVVCLDDEWDARVAPHGTGDLDARAGPDDLAYVIFTSGSTGRPKGVLATHAGLLHSTLARRDHYRGSVGTFLLVSPFAFDSSVAGLFWTLTDGGALVLPPQRDATDPEALVRLLDDSRVTHLLCTPSLHRALLHEAHGRRPAFLSTVAVAGEACPPDLVRLHFERLPHAELHNEYGPTEATVWCSVARLRPEDATRPVVPIGRPIANARLYVLDAAGEPVPPGVAGELHVGGSGVARGYLNHPDLTASRFVPDPHAGEPDARMYRTGDLVRHLPDGQLEFLGRLDNQVKVRGFRVELGEVEAALAQHPLVRECVVVPREDAPGDTRLVAYVAPAPLPQDLRAFVRERLPGAMVPSAFVALDTLPRSAHGKVDGKALPAPEGGRSDLGVPYEAPRDPAEEVLAGIWSRVLQAPQVGALDNFFDLGGHSLLATQVVSRVRDAFRVEVPLRLLFAHPTVRGLARAVLDLQRHGARPADAPIPAGPRDGLHPLSFAQERLWFLHEWEPESPTYHVPATRRLRGPLDADALERALHEVLRRHDVLRATFTTMDGRPMQRTTPHAPRPLDVLDLASLPPEAREAEARRLAIEEARAAFDLRSGPLVRYRLLRLAPEDHVLLLTFHHIAFDGWSMGLLDRELRALYAAFAKGEPSPLSDPPVQYADYARWQRAWLQGDVLDAQLAYWRGRLEGASPLELPTDRPRPAVRTSHGARVPFHWPRDLVRRLHEVSHEAGATPYMTLLAAFKTLLHRHTGQDDITVGSPIAGRGHKEVEGLLGFFVNTLVLRTDAGGDPTFLQLLARVRETCLGAYANQDVPFEKLVEALHRHRDPSRTPLFQALFVLQNAGRADAGLDGVAGDLVDVESATSKFDLTLSLAVGEEGIRGSLTYAADLFDEETMVRMVAHLDVLLRGIAERPDRRLSEFSLLTEDERRDLVEARTGPANPVPEPRLVHRLVERQAALAPDRLAVAWRDERLTYADLDARSERLALALRRLRLPPDAPVGVCLERSPRVLVAVLAALKAGRAYVPLDPAHPPARIALMLADARAPVLLTESSVLRDLGELPGVRALRLDAEEDAPAAEPDAREATPSDLAYVIYTSGSTGRPKGVMIQHASLANLVHWHNTTYRVTPDDRATLLAGLGFDASVWEAWPYLAAGASLHLPPDEETRADPERLVAWLAENDITISFLPTPLAERVLALDALPSLKLRALLTGGDRLRRAPPRPLPFDLVNHYGPTESTVVATATVVPASADDPRPPPIGRPILNTRAYVLDRHLQLAPPGVPGELFIGGDGLARGYVHRDDLTSERFLPDPFRGEGRMYRTGDLVRWRADGHLEFLGRLDHQVKVRGFRIELGEVETALRAHPAVADVAVLAPEDARGERHLVAYVVESGGHAAPAPELRTFLQARLPAAMVPSAFVLLDALPLTPNGKVDRKALATVAPAPAERAHAPPRTPTEAALAGIWAQVLRVDAVGVEDDFFALGGHSLLATQVVSRVRESLGVEVPLKRVFASPTLGALAAAIDAEARRGPASRPAPLSRASRAAYRIADGPTGGRAP